MASRETASGLVQAYVNTVDMQDGEEEFTGPNPLSAWLVARGLMEPAVTATPGDLKHAIAVRDAIRGIIGANSGGVLYPVDIATLNEAAAASSLRPRFGSDGKARLEPDAGGVVGALGRIVAAVVRAMAEEEWSHLKLCSSQACRRAFYDRSRNHSSRWCTMASCGNREKAKRFRGRAKRSTRTA